MVDITKVIESHRKWLCGECGDRADLSGTDLRGVNLRGTDLSGANLNGANLRGTDLSVANLNGTDLRGVDLSWADLSETDLSGADLSGADLKIYQSGRWTAYVQPDHIRIGCQYFRTEEWETFSDDRIAKMHPLAIDYWKENKHIVLSIARSLNKEISV